MASEDPRYLPHFPIRELLEFGRDNTIACAIFFEGAQVVPSSGTVEVTNQAQAVVFSGPATIAVDGTATATIPSASLVEADLADGWRVLWLLDLPEGATAFRRSCSLVRARLYPTVTDQDLYSYAPGLDPASEGQIVDRSNFQYAIDAADIEVQKLLIREGKRPWQIIEASQLRETWIFRALAHVYRGEASNVDGNPLWLAMEKKWHDLARSDWATLNFQYDTGNDGFADQRVAPFGVMWLS